MRKLLPYSHDTYGLGHIRRNLAIAEHLLTCRPDLQIVLTSGSLVGHRLHLPPGLQLVALPPVVKAGRDHHHPTSCSPGCAPRCARPTATPPPRSWRPTISALFMRHPTQILSRVQILNRVWDHGFDPGSSVVDGYVRYLRRKLNGPGEKPLLGVVPP